MNNKENWKTISDFPNYAVSDYGRVRRIVPISMPYGGTKPIKRLKQAFNNGYSKIQLWKNGVGTACLVHRLVLTAFVRHPKQKEQTNHRDGNKQNNRLDNLEWVTHQQNADHAKLHKLLRPPTGEKHYATLLTNKSVQAIRELYATGQWLQRNLGEKFNVSSDVISSIIRGENWKEIQGTIRPSLVSWRIRFPDVVPHGKNHWNSSLTEKDVIHIKNLRKRGISLVDISKKFNVSFQHISLIVRGKRWKHIS